MPEVTIVASWRVATARSLALTRANSSRLSSLERYLWAMSMTTSPRSLSWSATSCLEFASTSPAGGHPGQVHRLEDVGRHRLRRHRRWPLPGHTDQAAELLGRVGA